MNRKSLLIIGILVALLGMAAITVFTLPEKTKTIKVFVPQNIEAYRREATDLWNNGQRISVHGWPSVTRTITVPTGEDPMKAAAQAAANEIQTSGGRSAAEVIYLKQQNGTVYLLLRMDVDGWAGVSHSIALVHPIVERTLLGFPLVSRVIFGLAPGDSFDDAIKPIL